MDIVYIYNSDSELLKEMSTKEIPLLNGSIKENEHEEAKKN